MTWATSLEGRRALVTGAGQGVGRAIAAALAAAGAAVLVNDVVEERAASAASQLRAGGGDASPVAFDVTDYDAVSAAMAEWAPVDIVVNNAGNAGAAGFDLVSFVDTRPSDWDRYLAVNLLGVMHCTHAALPGMIDRGWGRVITIISDAARRGEARLAAYAAAKAGAAGFSRSIAWEVGRFGVTVNCVALGTIDTSEEGSAPADPEAEAQLQRRMRPYMIRRPGRPDDVAGVVTLLASDHACWITGQTYGVDGGYVPGQ